MNSELLKKYKRTKCKPNEKIKKGDILVFEYKIGYTPRFLEDCERTAFIMKGEDDYGNQILQTLDGKGGMKTSKNDGEWTHNIDKDRRFAYKLKLLPEEVKKPKKNNSYQRLEDLIF